MSEGSGDGASAGADAGTGTGANAGVGASAGESVGAGAGAGAGTGVGEGAGAGERREEQPKKKESLKFPDFADFGYRIFGNVAPRLVKYFPGYELLLKKAGKKITLVKYISETLLISLIALIVGLIVPIPILLHFLYPFFAIITTIAIGLMAGALAFVVMYIYPTMVMRSRTSAIERNLSFLANYMAILAGAGVIPEKIFRSVSKSDIDPSIKYEVSEIIRRMEVFGEDFYTALSIRVEETPSPKFAELLRGILLVGSTGGDMKRYLFLQGRRFMRMKNIALKKSLDGLGVMAEMYVTGGVVMPLILVVMLVTLSFLGGGSINALTWLYFTSYLMVPMVAGLMLVILDSSAPAEE
jgi:flagellar protein FlaJ